MERFDWLEVPGPGAPAARPGEEAFDARAYLQRGERAFRRGAYEAALRQYAKALGEDALLREAWLGQILSLAGLGEVEEARTWANKALERLGDAPELLAAKGYVLACHGEAADAMAYSDRAMATRDPSPAVWLMRGLTLLKAEAAGQGAGRCFMKALEQGDPEGHLSLRIGLGHLSRGDLPKAKERLQAASERGSDNPLAWVSLAECFEAMGALGRADSCYERALALDPEFKPKVVDALNRIRSRGFFSRVAGSIRALLGGRADA